MNQVKYLILGAGVSGISAANFLGPNEYYLILEKTE
jgi:protoporphyrinogen oxidase